MPVRNPLAIATLLCAVACASAQVQTPSSPAPAAPTAPPAAGQPALTSYTVSNGELVVAPGLRIPNGNVPWALDSAEGKQVLVPVHASSPSATGVLDAASSRSALRSGVPVFFVHATVLSEGDPGRNNATAWALVLLGDGGTVPAVKFADVGVTCAAPLICLQADPLPSDWQRLTPRAALAPGRYALLPVKRAGPPKTVVVYDFSVGEDASPRDTVQPGQAIRPVQIKHPAK